MEFGIVSHARNEWAYRIPMGHLALSETVGIDSPGIHLAPGDRLLVVPPYGISLRLLLAALTVGPPPDLSDTESIRPQIVGLEMEPGGLDQFTTASPCLGLCRASGYFATVSEELESMANPAETTRPSRLQEAIEHFNLDDLLKQSIYELSGGQQRLVELVGTLVSPRPVKVIGRLASDLDEHHISLARAWISAQSTEVFIFADTDIMSLRGLGASIWLPGHGVYATLRDLLYHALANNSAVPYFCEPLQLAFAAREKDPCYDVDRIASVAQILWSHQGAQ